LNSILTMAIQESECHRGGVSTRAWTYFRKANNSIPNIGLPIASSTRSSGDPLFSSSDLDEATRLKNRIRQPPHATIDKSCPIAGWCRSWILDVEAQQRETLCQLRRHGRMMRTFYCLQAECCLLSSLMGHPPR
jgi:hypothetical protein